MASTGAQPPTQQQQAPYEAPSDSMWTWVGLVASLLGIAFALLALLKKGQANATVSLAVLVFTAAVLALWLWRVVFRSQPQAYPEYQYAAQTGYGPDGQPRHGMMDAGGMAPRAYVPVAPAAPDLAVRHSLTEADSHHPLT